MNGPKSIEVFGPLHVGQTLDGEWSIASIDATADRARVALSHAPRGENAVLFVQNSGPDAPDGPFGIGGVLTYQTGDIDPADYHSAAMQIAALLQNASERGSLEESVDTWLSSAALPDAGPTTVSWKAAAIRRLVDHPETTLHLEEFLPTDSLPSAPCLLPWHRLEMNASGVVGPCCADYQTQPWRPGKRLSISEAWTSEPMQAFRRALVSKDPHQTCSRNCPHLRGGTCGASSIVVRGGTQAQVDRQLARLEAMIDGSDHVAVGPASVQFSPTSFCNYDCLMCGCGQTGTLDDELGDEFYDDLLHQADSLQSLEVCGGEPLASPRFRAFLSALPTGPLAHVSLGMTTNGSYLTPKIIDALGQIRWCSLIVSLNAGTEPTYDLVNRGLPYARVRKQLDGLLSRKAQGSFRGSVRYSMVILRANFHEIEDFAALCRADGVGYRFMLPQLNRNNQSIMLHTDIMRSVLERLERVIATDETQHRQSQWLQLVKGEVKVLSDRLAEGVVRTLPDTQPITTGA
jgi:molybdenum cofactor biosynthesis enzyme MoaA